MLERRLGRAREPSGRSGPGPGAYRLAVVLAAVGMWLTPSAARPQSSVPPPRNLRASVVDTAEIDLVWQRPSGLGSITLSGYRVYRDGTRVASTSDTTFADSGLQPGTTYTYYVTAVDVLGTESSPSDTATATTDARPPAADTTPPTVPAGLSASAVDTSRIALSWSASSDPQSGVTGYRVYRDGSRVASPSGTGYTDTGLQPGTSHAYRVSAVNGAGLESGRSDTATATTGSGASSGTDDVPPTPPTHVRIVSDSGAG